MWSRRVTETDTANSFERDTNLVVAGIYERQIGASLERVWENVYDWEHLPYLHSEAFLSIALVDSGDWGWRARVEMRGGSEAIIELIANRDAGHDPHYVARTIEGAGAPSEIWTSLDPNAPDRTGIRVEFCVERMPEEALRKVGKGLVGLYTLLWNQDEEMMQARTLALAARDNRAGSKEGSGASERENDRLEVRQGSGRGGYSTSLGTVDELRARLPLVVELSGHSFRIVEVEGEFVAHSTECPHLLGPLGECATEGGELVCPWHGYAFDLRSGRSTDGRRLRLRTAPTIEIDANRQVVMASLSDDRSRSSGLSGSEGRHGSS